MFFKTDSKFFFQHYFQISCHILLIFVRARLMAVLASGEDGMFHPVARSRMVNTEFRADLALNNNTPTFKKVPIAGTWMRRHCEIIECLFLNSLYIGTKGEESC